MRNRIRLQAYQFIKYNNKTDIEHIKKYSEDNAILCFDFEDSIKLSEKQNYREYFKHIINNVLPMLPSTKICLRINHIHPKVLRKRKKY